MDIPEIIMKTYGISPLPKNATETMAYVPFQQCGSALYSPAQALEAGKIYPVLNKPFFGSKCGGKND
ncbi:MAG: spore coat associated protein CotJA [Ruminococcus sp.]|nr:spore coat associated protein CotJA [Ruminococcus sp.]